MDDNVAGSKNTRKRGFPPKSSQRGKLAKSTVELLSVPPIKTQSTPSLSIYTYRYLNLYLNLSLSLSFSKNLSKRYQPTSPPEHFNAFLASLQISSRFPSHGHTGI
ncbi:hypothetical protein L1887_23354 [Cichorium endivia]|nr:hypothetical protein L1887_23354 [Cichorium endivia]